jgi:hypothetical protein
MSGLWSVGLATRNGAASPEEVDPALYVGADMAKLS